jgi:RNA-dependent RNA polymerase
MGILTLPTATLGNMFLRDYGPGGRKAIHVSGRRLTFGVGRNAASPDVLEKIRSSPYIDPGVSEERDRIATTLDQSKMKVNLIQFGWDCRDQVFSAEWGHKPLAQSELSFDFFARSMKIVLYRANDYGVPNLLEWNSITIDHAQIISLSEVRERHSLESIVAISLYTPPTLGAVNATRDSESRQSYLDLYDSNNFRYHEEVANYVSTSIRLVCSGSSTFARLAEMAGMHVTVDNNVYPVVRRGLFSEDTLERFRKWIVTIDFHAAYQVEQLVNEGKVDPQEMMELQAEVRDIVRAAATKGTEYLTRIFHDFGREARVLWDYGGKRHAALRKCLLDVKARYDKPSSVPSLLTAGGKDGLFMCMHVYVSPTSIYLDGPTLERSNRVIRSFHPRYHRYFIRVSFVDEGNYKLKFSRSFDGPQFVRDRVGSILKNGLLIAGRRYRYLAYSQSSLKEHSVWFMRPFRRDDGQVVDVDFIIKGIGSFSDLPSDPRLMYCPARYAARISQAFTSTDPTVTVVESIRTNLPDIIKQDPATLEYWNHTDGVGTMSPEFARSIYEERMRNKKGRKREIVDYPRALQIRFMGSKGMLSVDHRLVGKTVCLRPSMIKFAGTKSNKIEIAKVFDRPGQ